MPAKDTNLRPRLTAAATKLRDINEPDLAEAIDTVLAPNGWGRLRRSDPTVSDSLDRNMAMRMPSDWREQIKARAQAAGNKLANDVNEGFLKYLNGEFDPVVPGRNPYGSGAEMVNLNVRAKDDLRVQVSRPEPKHSASLVAAAYLMSKYKVGPYAPKTAKK
ncbi:hypothetical protein OG369_42595 [Streptomyces sp. NBC_01221]|uniref:hypothetical protein n=1 Tax=Streptomyces sp. NBC_01221 TaxID=2903782 RepID=UPI0022536CF3|nr:hypothetical protein [Streptomyces sp. NBC_01221]MCX4792467.1 hypothetical protein [Streptomyces sp. NBC_01221]